MPLVMIVDSIKPSVVMSSEIFKDKIPGAVVLVAGTGKACLEMLAEHKPDICVVDFDLPDTDGATLIGAMRKVYTGPILLTAFPDSIVEEAVKYELFAFNDASAWIPKPVKFEVLSQKIDQFLVGKRRLGRRFEIASDIETMMVGKGAGRGKRAPKSGGKIVNLSLGGACVELFEQLKLKHGEEFTLTLPLPSAESVKDKNKDKNTVTKRKAAESEAKIKATIAWVDKKSQLAGLAFGKLSDVQKKRLETLLRSSISVV